MDAQERIEKALYVAGEESFIIGDHHKQWVIDQMIRVLTNCPTVEMTAKDYEGNPYAFQGLGESAEYLEWVADYQRDSGHKWDAGIAP